MPDAPRWLDAPAAAAHLSMRVDAFLRAVKAGTFPTPSRHIGPRTPRWDRISLDSAMAGAASNDIGAAIHAVAEEIRAGGRRGRAAQHAVN